MIENKPLVTILLLTYNQQEFIADSIKSALNQDYPKLQIIISDDSSSDKTYEIAKNVVENYVGEHHVTLRKTKENLGIGTHFNDVLPLVDGDYVFLAAGDDISCLNRVSLFYDNVILTNSDFKAGFSNLMIIDELSREVRPLFLEKPTFPQSIGEFEKKNTSWCVGASLVIHRSLYDDYGEFVMGTRQEDGCFAFRAILKGEFIYYDEITVYYRHHGGNISQGLNLSQKIEFKKKEHILWENWLKDALIYNSNNVSLIEVLEQGLKSSLRRRDLLSIKYFGYVYYLARESYLKLVRYFSN